MVLQYKNFSIIKINFLIKKFGYLKVESTVYWLTISMLELVAVYQWLINLFTTVKCSYSDTAEGLEQSISYKS